MTDPVARLRELLAKATPGPWRIDKLHTCWSVRAGMESIGTIPFGWDKSPEKIAPRLLNAETIVEAINALPGLLDRLDAAEKRAEEAERLWPDIGPDPFSGVSADERAANKLTSKQRLTDAFCVQQPHVPNQTALVWRVDLIDQASGLRMAEARATALAARCERLEAALEVGELFRNACRSAWSCGEPSHRVKVMMDRFDDFGAALDQSKGEGRP